jgi:hypothetical protein
VSMKTRVEPIVSTVELTGPELSALLRLLEAERRAIADVRGLSGACGLQYGRAVRAIRHKALIHADANGSRAAFQCG